MSRKFRDRTSEFWVSDPKQLQRKGEKAVSTQKTLDKQTATFVAALAQSLPNLSADRMQFYIENPAELRSRLANLRPTLTEHLEQTGMARRVELIKLIPGSDFRIMRMMDLPELGIVVSDRQDSCFEGLILALPGKKSSELFRSPCGCCHWVYQFSGAHKEEKEILHVVIKAIRDKCKEKGIKTILFNFGLARMEQGVDGLQLIDPSNNVGLTEEIKSQLRQTFSWLSIQNDHGEPLSALYTK